VTRRIDPREAELVIAGLRAANPVRREAGRRPPDQVDAFLLQVMERTDMVQDITKRVASSKPLRQPMPRWVVFAAGFAFAALIAIPVLLLNRGPADPALADLPPAHAQLVAKVVETVNDEDFDAFRSLFAADGSVGFETGMFRPYHQGVEAGQPIPVTDEAGFEADFAWGAVLDRRVSLRACEPQNERILRCEISFSLEAFRAGWVETMGIALAESGGISLLSTEPLDVDPVDRDQPLSFIGYYEFQDWLETTHPDEYQRLVDPGTPGSIKGVEIELGMAPQNPDLVDEFTALIDEYLASR
jgi:hypothetical protein